MQIVADGLPISIVAAGGLATLVSCATAGDKLQTESRTAHESPPAVTLCDLVEQALLATTPKPTPAVEWQEREQRRAKIEHIRRQVQQLRDEGRCP
jgi:hypothetical protein